MCPRAWQIEHTEEKCGHMLPTTRTFPTKLLKQMLLFAVLTTSFLSAPWPAMLHWPPREHPVQSTVEWPLSVWSRWNGLFLLAVSPFLNWWNIHGSWSPEGRRNIEAKWGMSWRSYCTFLIVCTVGAHHRTAHAQPVFCTTGGGTCAQHEHVDASHASSQLHERAGHRWGRRHIFFNHPTNKRNCTPAESELPLLDM